MLFFGIIAILYGDQRPMLSFPSSYLGIFLFCSLIPAFSTATTACIMPKVLTTNLALEKYDGKDVQIIDNNKTDWLRQCRCPVPEQVSEFTSALSFRMVNFCSGADQGLTGSFLFAGDMKIKGKIHTEASVNDASHVVFAPEDSAIRRLPQWKDTSTSFYRVAASKNVWKNIHGRIARYTGERNATVHITGYIYTNTDDRDPIIIVSKMRLN